MSSNEYRGSCNYYNKVRSNFMRDNSGEIKEMRESVRNKIKIEILSGPCNGMTIDTICDIYTWVDERVKNIIGPWNE